MPLRSWIILGGSTVGCVYLALGIDMYWPPFRFLATGCILLFLTLVYARLTGLPWLPQIVRILADLVGRPR